MKKERKIILIGTPNVGKTTCFNQLTGRIAPVSNFSGTTVDYHEGMVKNFAGISCQIIDTPGIYGRASCSKDQKLTWEIIEENKNNSDTTFVQILDPQEIEKSLILTLTLCQHGICPRLVINNRKFREKINPQVLANIKEKIKLPILLADIEDENFAENFWEFIKKNKGKKLNTNLPKTQKRKFIREEILVNFAKTPCQKRTDRLDKILLHRFWGIPIFFAIMYLVFQLTFTVGSFPMGWIDAGISSLQNYLSASLPNTLLTDLLVNGIIAGTGGILIFLPNILILFFLLSFLQQSGYLSRVAFLLDLVFQKFGVTGKASVPLLMGFGCNVPAIMATRTLQTRKERIITSLMSVFMSCSARLPVLTILIASFVPEDFKSLTLFGAYLFGIFVAFLTGLIFNKSLKSAKNGWILAMPNYSWPKLKRLWRFVSLKAYYFLVKVGKILLPLSVVFWLIFAFPQVEVRENGIQESYGAIIGRTIQPVFAPLGFDWKISTSLLAGISAKEIMIVNLSEIYSLNNGDETGLIETLRKNLSFPSAMALLVFTLLYTPCFAVIGVLKAEFGTKWAIIGILYPTIIAWIFAFLTYRLCLLF